MIGVSRAACVLALLAGCFSMSCARTQNRLLVARCGVDTFQWSEFTPAPEEQAELVALVGDDVRPKATRYWFKSGSDRILLCQTSRLDQEARRLLSADCFSDRTKFTKVGGIWSKFAHEVTLCKVH